MNNSPSSGLPAPKSQLPEIGWSATDVFDSLELMRARDVRWREGRAFSLAYNAGPDALAVAEEAYRRFSGENALSTDAFPSLRQIQAEVVAMDLSLPMLRQVRGALLVAPGDVEAPALARAPAQPLCVVAADSGAVDWPWRAARQMR